MIRKNTSNSGFTLVELLIVVSIIGILAAFAIPAMGRARDQSEVAQCASNMRNVYLFYMQEAQDNDLILPLSYDYTANIGWTDKLYNSLGGDWQRNDLALKKSDVVGCPSHRRKMKLFNSRRTFSINLPLTDNNFSPKIPGPKLVSFSDTSKTILISDGALKANGSPNSGFNNSDKLPDRPHQDKANMLFLDGHVETWDKAALAAVTGTIAGDGSTRSIFWIGK